MQAIFDPIGYLLAKIFDVFKELNEWLKDNLLIVLTIIIVIIAIFAPYLVPLFAAFLPAWLATLLTFIAANWIYLLAVVWGLGFLLDPDGTIEQVERVAEILADAASTIGGAIGTVAGGLFSGLFSSPIGIGLLAFGAWYFFLRKKDTPTLIAQDGDQSDPESLLTEQPLDNVEPEPTWLPSTTRRFKA